ncbi:MAG: DUF1269 domain-containing protein, partial [Anaerolineae bacterium]|nr:DUF1269 domain-containing protein [Anaerolineae bacterium]
GAVTGGLTASLIDLGVPEDQVNDYGEAIRRGSPMVAVIAEETRVREAMRALGRHNPYDLELRAHEWQQQGWKGHDEGYNTYTDRSDTRTQSEQMRSSAALNENRVRRYNPNTPR